MAPDLGEADELNVPAWLWPELTMHLTSVTGRRNVRQPNPTACSPSSRAMVRSLLCLPQRFGALKKRGGQEPPDGGSVAMVAGTIKRRGRQGCPCGRA